MVALLFHLDAVDAMLSRTCSRHGTPSTRRSKKDAVSHARRERALFNFMGVLDGRLGHADGLWVSGGGRGGEVDARGFGGWGRVGACERRAALMLFLLHRSTVSLYPTGTPSLRRLKRTPCHARFARRIVLAGAASSFFGVGASSCGVSASSSSGSGLGVSWAGVMAAPARRAVTGLRPSVLRCASRAGWSAARPFFGGQVLVVVSPRRRARFAAAS